MKRRKPKFAKFKQTDSGVRCTCGHKEPLAAYAVAQMAMRVPILFVCPKCKARHPIN